MRVVALFRVSTEKQGSEGASLDAQERIYREWAARSGWTTVAEFKGCESATQAASDRRVLQQVLECIRKEAPDAIYVHEQSRLTRGDQLEVVTLMRELTEGGIKIIVNGVVRDLSSIDERFMVGIQSLVDRAESERIKERMVRGKRERGRQGKKNSGPAPFGYTNPPPGAPGRGTLQVVPEEAAVVRRIFELASRGKGTKAIAKILTEQGLKGPRGNGWGGTTVLRVINCLAYIGTAATNVWVAEKGSRTFRFDPTNPRAILIENAHEPIIDRELWDAVHGRPRQPRTAHPRLLTGMMWVNGEPAHGDIDHGRSCYRGPRGLRGLPWLDVQAVDDAVWDAFASLATEPAFVERLLRESQNPREQDLARQEVEFLTDQIAKARRRLDRLVEMRAEGDIDKDTFRAKRAETEEAIARLQADLAVQRARAAAVDGTAAARVVGAVRVLLAGRTALTTEQKRRVLASIVRRIDVTAERTGADFRRDERGRVQPGREARWAVGKIAFRLALPDAPVAQERDGGRPGANGGAWRDPVEAVEAFRTGQKDPAFSDCGQLSETAGRHRTGHKTTTH